MKISILLPCYNEEKTISKSIESCLNQTRMPDEIVAVNDGSTDNTLAVLTEYANKYSFIKVVNLIKNQGSKGHAQEKGLEHVTGDVLITGDADTLFDSKFVENIEREFKDPKTMAVAGYVKSLKGNLLTACRELEYFYVQEIYKNAQAKLDAIYVIPGCASAFRKKVFNVMVKFSHDTITEDLDFTYQFHKLGVKIKFCKDAIVYTQDPSNLYSYTNQMRRWYSGGWQNLFKHWREINNKSLTMEIVSMFGEVIILGAILFLSPFIDIDLFWRLLISSIIFNLILGAYAGWRRGRFDLFVGSSLYVFVMMLNTYIFFEQMVKHLFFKNQPLVWFKPERRIIV